MVEAIGARWHIEEDFETGKDMGLDQYARPQLDRLVSTCYGRSARPCLRGRDLCSGESSHDS
jgi:hypothetical protein